VKDAENALLSRFNRLRLDYEQMRDSTSAACGSLNVANAGGRTTPLAAPDMNARRSLYLFIDREVQASVPAMFDFANPDIHSPQRSITTVPPAGLVPHQLALHPDAVQQARRHAPSQRHRRRGGCPPRADRCINVCSCAAQNRMKPSWRCAS